MKKTYALEDLAVAKYYSDSFCTMLEPDNSYEVFGDKDIRFERHRFNLDDLQVGTPVDKHLCNRIAQEYHRTGCSTFLVIDGLFIPITAELLDTLFNNFRNYHNFPRFTGIGRNQNVSFPRLYERASCKQVIHAINAKQEYTDLGIEFLSYFLADNKFLNTYLLDLDVLQFKRIAAGKQRSRANFSPLDSFDAFPSETASTMMDLDDYIDGVAKWQEQFITDAYTLAAI